MNVHTGLVNDGKFCAPASTNHDREFSFLEIIRLLLPGSKSISEQFREWEKEVISTDDLSDLETLLKLAYRFQFGLPELPGKPENLTNVDLHTWCLKANDCLEKGYQNLLEQSAQKYAKQNISV